MNIATHHDVVRLFPGIQALSVTKVLAMRATVNELEAALLLIQGNDDEELIETRNQNGTRLNSLLELLADYDVQMSDDF